MALEGDRKKVALLFGTFNPLHEGHLAILDFILKNCPELSQARLVVSPQSPFKDGLMSSASKRLEAARAALSASGLNAVVSDVEFRLEPPLYTINTLRFLRDSEPDTDFVLVMGADNIESLERWHESDAILSEFEIWVYPRDGVDARAFCDRFNARPSVRGVRLLDAPMHNISSTQIRRRANHYDVIVIGGGITGAGVARDCALRGLKVLLAEKADFANGASGRNHGLLHSGARYAVGDAESARECIEENLILRHIAPHCIERNDGLFISLPEDDPAYQAKFIQACRRSGIDAQALDPQEAIRLEPSVNPVLTGAVRVPDGSVDPFRLVMSNIVDAKAHGAKVLLYNELLGFIKDGDRIIGVNLRDRASGEVTDYYGEITVNAAGIWGAGVAQMAGAHIKMFPAKGTLLVFGHRVNNMVINRCRKSADGDILVPGESVSILGTTSTRVPYDSIDDVRPTSQEVDLLIREGKNLVPSLVDTRILRAYSGVRPLVAADDDPDGRNISRGIVLFDHEERDGIKGLVTITGGKLMTYRLMAQMASDLVCRKLGVSAECTTAGTVLPVPLVRNAGIGRNVVCECENVTEEQIRYAVDNLEAKDLSMLRRRTRLGMGTCQGQLCARRAAGMTPDADLRRFVNERWKGVAAVAWGDALREAQLTQWLYKDEI